MAARLGSPKHPRHRKARLPDARSNVVRPVDALAAFVASAPISMAITDREIRFLAASQRWLTDVGKPLDEVIGRTSYELLPDTEKRYAPLHRKCLRGEAVSGQTEEIDLPNGERRWMTWDATPWRDENGEVGGLLITSRDVTAHRLAEEQLEQTRAFAATILENSPAPMVVKDADGRVLMINRAMEQFYGVDRRDHIGHLSTDLVAPEEAEAIREEDRRILASGKPIVVAESPTMTEFGLRYVRKSKVAIRGEAGRTFLLTICEDITEAKRTREELERTREFLTSLIEHVPIALVVKEGRSGRVVMMNRANEALVGAPREELIGKTGRDFLSKDMADRMEEHDRAVITSGEVHVSEDEDMVTRQGEHRRLRQMKLAVPSPEGEPYILTISEDITQRTRAAEELMRTRAFLETVIEHVPAGLTVKDSESGRLMIMNPAVAEIYGIAPGENLGRTSAEVFPADQARRFEQQDREVMQSGELRVFDEEPVWTRKGERYLRRWKAPVRNTDGPDYLLTITEDVTERKQAGDALKEALARAEAANVAKSEFLANMSHEIRTPLNGVLGLADALARMDLTDRQREIVDMIVGSGRALTMILSDVLDLAKAEAGQLQLQEEPFALRETIGQAAFLFETVARDKGVGFHVDFAQDAVDALIGDPLRIKQVVSNLISNAVKFTSDGEVTIEVTATPSGEDEARLCVTVRDTGPGFSEEVRARLFSRFEQGDGSITRRFGGTGLGLSIAGALTQMMGGEIDCSSIEGMGATFVFRTSLRIDHA
ncbi:MAG: PAS domain-containing protein, partial [Phenylobacterium sp.]